MKKLTFISLFAGIGGFDLGFERAGMQCVAQVEKDPFCLKVLAKHWPNVKRFEDVKEVGKHNLPAADVICGGFPCQPHSYAGKRKGAADDRDLWPEYFRIINELRPTWVVGENVPGIRTTILDKVLSDLESIGYSWETFIIPACAKDAPHRRDRVWIVAYSNSIGCSHGKSNIYTAKAGEYALSFAGAKSENVPHSQGNGWEQGKQNSGGRGKGMGQEQGSRDGCEVVPNPNGVNGRVGAGRQNGAKIGTGGKAMENTQRNGSGAKIKRGKVDGAQADRPTGGTSGSSWWPVEPGVGGIINGFSSWLDGVGYLTIEQHLCIITNGIDSLLGSIQNADAKKKRTNEILQGLRSNIKEANIQGQVGGFRGIQEKEILFAYLCKFEKEFNKTRLQLESAKASSGQVRGMSSRKEFASAPYRPGYNEQREEQHTDTLQTLSQLLAYYAKEAWQAYSRENAISFWAGDWEQGIPRVETKIPRRVDRLRSLGNAVVPQVAQFIGELVVKADSTTRSSMF